MGVCSHTPFFLLVHKVCEDNACIAFKLAIQPYLGMICFFQRNNSLRIKGLKIWVYGFARIRRHNNTFGCKNRLNYSVSKLFRQPLICQKLDEITTYNTSSLKTDHFTIGCLMPIANRNTAFCIRSIVIDWLNEALEVRSVIG
jgi:hypothetical protein